ncbi:uncharacterized protein F4822DRAFT_96972 [Hypoxylon trugodes]|uniref:uncharacterized protein n=1 Tax=Hypoxylon trugodes TaxID=326681 RepID=UPI0021915B1E|nr:uncharacterized protein F4822DRAFT_96972 [Hypoxylon trugodes]KAI1382787.1 hypothetical protein F4822DRAFT_96972 [Hypoxylon trugodes]
MSRSVSLFTTLIRTHHITSRKKLARVKKAAESHHLHVLVRSCGSPGIMYAEGPDAVAINTWVSFVQALRYKDFQCPRKPVCHEILADGRINDAGFEEVASVAEFGKRMEQRGLGGWWRIGMGYEYPDE